MIRQEYKYWISLLVFGALVYLVYSLFQGGGNKEIAAGTDEQNASFFEVYKVQDDRAVNILISSSGSMEYKESRGGETALQFERQLTKDALAALQAVIVSIDLGSEDSETKTDPESNYEIYISAGGVSDTIKCTISPVSVSSCQEKIDRLVSYFNQEMGLEI